MGVALCLAAGCTGVVVDDPNSTPPDSAVVPAAGTVGTSPIPTSTSTSASLPSGGAMAPACSNTLTDPSNCGACGTVCADGYGCTAGTCACSSGASCNGACTDLSTDDSNCGACSNSCASQQSCVAGACVCAAGYALCAAGCANTNADGANCGACGAACAPGSVCANGRCSTAGCGAGLVSCNQSCVAVATSPSNCGACGNACPAGASCTAGKCVNAKAVPFATIAALLKKDCASSSCHGGRQKPNLSTTSALSATLLNTAVGKCGSDHLVAANDPANSALLELLNHKCGSLVMPKGCTTTPCLGAADMTTITTWIQAGAPPQ